MLVTSTGRQDVARRAPEEENNFSKSTLTPEVRLTSSSRYPADDSDGHSDGEGWSEPTAACNGGVSRSCGRPTLGQPGATTCTKRQRNHQRRFAVAWSFPGRPVDFPRSSAENPANRTGRILGVPEGLLSQVLADSCRSCLVHDYSRSYRLV
jgi:hypothetical protein